MRAWHATAHALAIAGSMTWEILWALILGFGLSAIVQPSSGGSRSSGCSAARSR